MCFSLRKSSRNVNKVYGFFHNAHGRGSLYLVYHIYDILILSNIFIGIFRKEKTSSSARGWSHSVGSLIPSI